MKRHDKSSKAIKSSKKGATELTEEEAARVTGGTDVFKIDLRDVQVSGVSN